MSASIHICVKTDTASCHEVCVHQSFHMSSKQGTSQPVTDPVKVDINEKCEVENIIDCRINHNNLE